MEDSIEEEIGGRFVGFSAENPVLNTFWFRRKRKNETSAVELSSSRGTRLVCVLSINLFRVVTLGLITPLSSLMCVSIDSLYLRSKPPFLKNLYIRPAIQLLFKKFLHSI